MENTPVQSNPLQHPATVTQQPTPLTSPQPVVESTPQQVPSTTMPPALQGKKKTPSLFLIIFGLLFVFVAAGAAYYFWQQSRQALLPTTDDIIRVSPTVIPSEDEMVACTMDAKICPDGSSVGRVPPSCEFEACPGEGVTGSNVPSVCDEGYYLSETDSFTLCIPNEYTETTYNKDEYSGAYAFYKIPNTEKNISVHEQFIGGWGPNPCAKEVKIDFLGSEANQHIEYENVSSSDFDDPNAECGDATESMILSETWSIGMNGFGESIDLTILEKVKNSFFLK